ncbi:MAG: hypothetical protein AB7G75_00745 [Candidatus Binatia bacterium]
MQRNSWHLAAVMAILLLATRAEAVMVMPFNVEELTQRADKIFVGTCTKISPTVTAQGIPVLEVTFSVSAALKGEIGHTVTFQQLNPNGQRKSVPTAQPGGLIQENPNSMLNLATLAQVPTYSVGEEVVLFLAAPGKLGLTAPIGLTQGKLPVTTLASGHKVITNTALRKTGLRDSALPDPGKTAEYDKFLAVLQTLTHTAK